MNIDIRKKMRGFAAQLVKHLFLAKHFSTSGSEMNEFLNFPCNADPLHENFEIVSKQPPVVCIRSSFRFPGEFTRSQTYYYTKSF